MTGPVRFGDCTLYHRNCLDVMPGLLDVDAVIADPPYGTTQCSWDSVIPLDELWPLLVRCTKPTAAIALMAQTPFDKVLGVSQLPMLRYEWIWEKTAATGFLNAKKMPMKAHENILVFYQALPTYNPTMTSGHERKTALRRRASLGAVYGVDEQGSDYNSAERYPRSVQQFPKDKQKGSLHPTQKPLALMEYLIHTYTNPGDTVLDFCMGSGTTGVACMNTGRKFIGIELDTKHFDTACTRIEAEYSQLKMDIFA